METNYAQRTAFTEAIINRIMDDVEDSDSHSIQDYENTMYALRKSIQSGSPFNCIYLQRITGMGYTKCANLMRLLVKHGAVEARDTDGADSKSMQGDRKILIAEVLGS